MDFPEIVLAEEPPFEVAGRAVAAQPAPTAITPLATVREHALAPLSKVALGIAQLRVEHGSTNYDITTPNGMKLAKARRHAIRLVRYEVPNVVKAKRAELDALKKDISAEGDRITAELLAIEKPHDDLIQAEEERREELKRQEAEAKAAAERAEAERKQRHADGLAKMRNYLTVAGAPGMTAERIAKGIALLEAVPTGPEWEEFAGQAADTKTTTLAAMHDLHAKAVAAEAEAARVEAQRVENERQAAALAEQQRLLAEREAALKKAEDEAAARARAEEERLAAEKRRAEEAAAAQAAADAAAAEAAAQAERERQARATAPVDRETGEILVPAAKPATVPVSPRMTLAQLQYRLELPITEQLLTRLGFPVLQQGAASGLRVPCDLRRADRPHHHQERSLTMLMAFGQARVGRDAEVRNTGNGDPVCNVSLAFNYGRKGDDNKYPTQWVEGTLWGNRAEGLAQYLTKGTTVTVQLEDVHVEYYQDNDGNQRDKLVGRIAAIDLGARPQGDNGGGGRQQGNDRGGNNNRGNGNGNGRPQQRGNNSQGNQSRGNGGGQQRGNQSHGGRGFDDMDDDIPF